MNRRLCIEPLETRDVPAGLVTADVVGGVLVLAGDAEANSLVVRFGVDGVTLTPSADTRVNDGDPGEVISLGAATGLKAKLGDGDDSLTTDDSADADLPKGVTVDGGDGANTIVLQRLAVPKLKVTTGAGDDDVQLVDLVVAKGATVNLGAGAADALTVDGTSVGATLKVRTTGKVYGSATFAGTGSVGKIQTDTYWPMTATFGVGSSYTVAGDVALKSKIGYSRVIVDGGTIGARNLTVTGGKNGQALLDVVNGGRVGLAGNLTLNGPSQAAILQNLDGDLVVAGDIKLTAKTGFASVGVYESDLSARNVSAKAAKDTALLGQSGASMIDLSGKLTLVGLAADFAQASGATATIAGDLKVSGRDNARWFQQDAGTTLTVGGKLDVRSTAGLLVAKVVGQKLSVGGPTTLEGAVRADVEIDTVATSELTAPVKLASGTRPGSSNGNREKTVAEYVMGDVEVKTDPEGEAQQGLGIVIIIAVGAVPHDHDKQSLRADLPASITLGLPGAPVTIEGNLLIKTGGEADTVTLGDLTVTGDTIISTGGENDYLQVDDSTFEGAFTADLGAGNDAIYIAQLEGSSAATTFTGKATIKAGDGEDQLRLGRLAGDSNSKAVFVAAGSTIDGGGVPKDFFDDELGLFTGIALGTGLTGWTDPTV